MLFHLKFDDQLPLEISQKAFRIEGEHLVLSKALETVSRENGYRDASQLFSAAEAFPSSFAAKLRWTPQQVSIALRLLTRALHKADPAEKSWSFNPRKRPVFAFGALPPSHVKIPPRPTAAEIRVNRKTVRGLERGSR